VLAQSDGKLVTYLEPAVSPDGKFMIYSQKNLISFGNGSDRWNGILYKMDLQTLAVTRFSPAITNNQYKFNFPEDYYLIEDYPDISQDGKYLALVSNRNGFPNGLDVFSIIDLTDLSLKVVPNMTETQLVPKISPDGHTIAYSDWDGNDFEIYTIGVDGTGLTQITDNSFPNRFPSWSPDGKKLLYESFQDNTMKLYLYDLANKSTTQLMNKIAVGDENINWSPDGKMLLFSTADQSGVGIFVMNIATTETKRILPCLRHPACASTAGTGGLAV
jgi:Tol biopolymer transport system component